MTSSPLIDGPRVAPASGQPPRQVVVLLHGYGSNGDDLISLAPYWRDALPDAVFVSPNAPQPCLGVPGGYQWWPIRDFSLAERAAGARSAAPVLDAFIDAQLARYGVTEDQLALVGFSQGTMMALHCGPRRPRVLAGIVGYSGMVTDEAGLEAELVTRPPVLLAHGDADPTVPVAAYHAAMSVLTRLDFDVAGYVAPGLGHSIDAEGLRLGGQFLARRFAAHS